MTKEKSCNKLKSIDRFGQNVEFTFQGSRTHKTGIGAFVTLLCVSLMIAFCTQRTSKLISRDDPFLTMTSNSKDDSIVQLGPQGFMFALTEIDPKVGVLSAKYVKRGRIAEDKKEEEIPIELVPCEELLPGGKYEGRSNNPHFDIQALVDNRWATHICPIDIGTINLTGIYESPTFNYVKISIKGCQLEDGTCFDDE